MKSVRKAKNLIERTIESMNTTQAQLAEELKVSPAQISKWKNGDSIPSERVQELRCLIGEDLVPKPLRKIFERIKDDYLDDNEGTFENVFDEIVEILFSQMSQVSLRIPQQYLHDDYESDMRPDLEVEAAFEDIIHGLLSNIQILERWFETFVSDVDARGDIFELGEDIRQWFTNIAWKEISNDTLHKCGVDIYQLSLTLEMVDCHLKADLYNFCKELNATNTAFTTDYHILLDTTPVANAYVAIGRHEILKVKCKSSSELLPYSDQVILSEIRNLQEQLKNL